MKNSLKIIYITLGCYKNLVDSEIALNEIEKNGFEITNNLSDADVAIINTCTFIEEATTESINKIIEVGEYKKKKLKKLIVTGCMGQRYKNRILKELPEVDYVLGTGNLLKIIDAINEKERSSDTNGINSKEAFITHRKIQTPKSYVFLRIAEGCDNFCSYCIIPKLRGRYRSRDENSIINEIKTLIEKGYKEIDLIAEDITRYGEDIGTSLTKLLKRINDIDLDFSVRLLYCYPENITDELINVIKDSEKILKYIDIPIQHFSDKILNRMNRNSTSSQIESLLKKLKSKIPDIFIRTSLIVGFPGETEKDIKEIIKLINMKLIYHAGIFKYSREKGTKAYDMKKQVSEEVKEQRKKVIENIQNKVVDEYNQNIIGNEYEVIVDGVAEDGMFYTARTYFQAPEIDNQTFILGLKDLKIGDKVLVKILNIDDNNLIGEILT